MRRDGGEVLCSRCLIFSFFSLGIIILFSCLIFWAFFSGTLPAPSQSIALDTLLLYYSPFELP